MTLTYQLGNKLYLNITNRCPCDCVFCLRQDGDSVGDAKSLWLEHEPTADELIEDISKRELSAYDEIVFCGYGEPTESFDVLIAVAKHIKKIKPYIPVRLNTNGLSDLINSKETAPLFKGLIDTMSISLNAPDAKRYGELSRPSFGTEKSFDSLLKFAADCKDYVKEVVFTIVDSPDKEEIKKCRVLAEDMGITLRVREFISNQ